MLNKLPDRARLTAAIFISFILHTLLGAVIHDYPPIKLPAQTGGTTGGANIALSIVPAPHTNSHIIGEAIKASSSERMSPASKAPKALPDLAITSPKLIWVAELDLELVAQQSESGYVELEIIVTPEGIPAKIRSVETNLPPVFFEVARKAFANARFEPGTLGGYPMAAIFRVRAYFQTDVEASVEGQNSH